MKSSYGLMVTFFLAIFLFSLVLNTVSYISIPNRTWQASLIWNSKILYNLAFFSFLWLLIKKRLFVPAHYVGCLAAVLMTYGIGMEAYQFSTGIRFPSDIAWFNTLKKALGIALLIFTPFIALLSYFIFAIYPKNIIKTAKKLKLGYWKEKP